LLPSVGLAAEPLNKSAVLMLRDLEIS
jgi:hypothetical protein